MEKVLQWVRFSTSEDILKQFEMPSPEDMKKCQLTARDLVLLTGQERRAVLQDCGVPSGLLPCFLRALQFACAVHITDTVEDANFVPFRKRSASNWIPTTVNESVFGQSIVSTSSPDGPSKSPPVSTPTAPPSTSPKQATGAVGIRNQGSTCYLNSLLQALYHLTAFRVAIYNMPIDAESPSTQTSIPLALQRLFLNLETSDSTVETTALTVSFGWSTRDAFVQHDIHELTRILLDNLEEKLKNAGQENIIRKLFCGAIENYTVVQEADFTNSQNEIFYDLTLVIRGCNNIYESFDNFFQSEILDGKNKYCLERDGKKAYHRAERGIRWKTAPPVLLLHLNRIDFDAEKGDFCKVLSRWDFYDVIDLRKYLPGEEDVEYRLHSVLVHSGSDARCGHYCCYIKVRDEWLKFNDEIVEKATPRDVFGANFGGTAYNYWGAEVHLTTNAYMLVYLRRSIAKEIVRPLEPSEIPQSLRDLVENERLARERVRNEQLEQHLFLKIHVVTEQDIRKSSEITLLRGWSVKNMTIAGSIRQVRTSMLNDCRPEIEKLTGIPPEKQLIWITEPNASSWMQALRFGKLLDEKTSLQQMQPLHYSARDCVVLVTNSDLLLCEGGTTCLTHHKLYDPFASTLAYLGAVAVGSVAVHVRVLEKFVRTLCERAEVSLPDMKLELLLEKEDGSIVSPPTIPSTGEVYVWQPVLTEGQRAQCDYPTVEEYKHFLQHKVAVHVHLNEPPSFPWKFDVDLADDASYERVQQTIAKKLGTENFDFIRLAQYNPDTKAPFFAKPKKSKRTTLSAMLRTQSTIPVVTDILFYEILENTVTEMENSNPLHFEYFNEHVKPVSSHTILFPLSGKLTVGDVLEKCAEAIGFEEAPPPLRLVDVWRGKIYNIYDVRDREIKSVFEERAEYRIEAIPQPMPLVPPQEQALLNVLHFSRSNVFQWHGDPFSLYIPTSDLIPDVLERIALKLALPVQTVSDWKLWLCTSHTPHELSQTVPVVEQWRSMIRLRGEAPNGVFLGLEHAMLPGNRRGIRHEERGIRILN